MVRKLREPGYAWAALVLALGLHVADEAANDFLRLYNPVALSIREALGVGPPTFTFEVWLSGLILAVAVLLLLTPLAAARSAGMRYFALFFAAFMVVNGLGHMVMSAFAGEIVAGTYSAPALLVAAANLWGVARSRWARGAEA